MEVGGVVHVDTIVNNKHKKYSAVLLLSERFETAQRSCVPFMICYNRWVLENKCRMSQESGRDRYYLLETGIIGEERKRGRSGKNEAATIFAIEMLWLR